jgi:hypothetical protein
VKRSLNQELFRCVGRLISVREFTIDKRYQFLPATSSRWRMVT